VTVTALSLDETVPPDAPIVFFTGAVDAGSGAGDEDVLEQAKPTRAHRRSAPESFARDDECNESFFQSHAVERLVRTRRDR